MPELQLAPSLKLALLLFDKIIAETGFKDSPEKLVARLIKEGKLTKKLGKKFLRLIVPIDSVIPGFEMGDLLPSRTDVFLNAVTEECIDTEYRSKGLDPPDEAKMLYDIRYASTLAAFENWFALSRQLSCLFIPNYYEEPILREFLKFITWGQKSETRSYSQYEGVVTKILPSVEDLSLGEILELRRHEYFSSFRAKTRALVDRISSVEDDTQVRRLIAEEEEQDLGVMQDLFRPKPFLKLVRAIIGNIPLPVIPNPLGIYDAVDSVRRDFKASKEVGWLYFIRDFKKRGKK
jgi:hypothetical protein